MGVATLRQRRSNPTSFTVAQATAIPKGTLCKLTNPRTAIANDTSGSVIAGICARDFVGGEGLTEAPMFTDGIFDMDVSGSAVLGEAIQAATANSEVTAATAIRKGRMVIGTALETGADNAKIQIELNVGAGSNSVS